MFALAGSLSACSSGSSPTNPLAPSGYSNGTLSLGFPPKSTGAHKRRQLYLSPSAKSVSVAVTGISQNVVVDVSATSPSCTVSGGTRSCLIALKAPIGSDTFTATIYDAANATGNVLGLGSATQSIVAGGPFMVTLGVSGVSVSISVLAGQTQFVVAQPATAPVTLAIFDADGNQIQGTYNAPITLANSDITGTFTIAPTTVTSSAQTITLSYNGGGAIAQATISASAPNVPGGNVKTQVVTVGTPMLVANTFPLPAGSVPNQFTAGPDGNVWYASAGTNPAIGRVTISNDAVTEFPTPVDPVDLFTSYMMGITAANDGNLYATNQQCTVFRITPAGVISPLSSLASCPRPGFLTQGPDGALWVVLYGASSIGRFPLGGGAATVYPLPTANAFTYNSQIVTGPDSALWFSEKLKDKIGRITTAGAITEYPVSANSFPQGIVAPSDGNIWFTEPGRHAVGRLTPGGTLTEFSISDPTVQDAGLTVGKDGNLYFSGSPNAGKVNLAGAVTLYAVGGNGIMGDSIATGPDGKLYTVLGKNSIPNPFDLLVFSPQ